MTWIPIILKFFKTYYKQIGVAVVAGLIILGVSVLWGRLYVAQGEIAKLTGTVELLETREKGWAKSLETCLEANEDWRKAFEELKSRSELLAVDRDRYLEELQAALAALQAAQDPPVDLDEAVTSEECSGAVRELVAALSWGGEQ